MFFKRWVLVTVGKILFQNCGEHGRNSCCDFELIGELKEGKSAIIRRFCRWRDIVNLRAEAGLLHEFSLSKKTASYRKLSSNVYGLKTSRLSHVLTGIGWK
jgi:hypothetical protein